MSKKKKRVAAAEMMEAFKAATKVRQRSVIIAFPYGPSDSSAYPVDVTEEVVSILDMITTSMDWGSDFWSDDDLPAFITLCNLLKFDEKE
jgi:hypothetical protein